MPIEVMNVAPDGDFRIQIAATNAQVRGRADRRGRGLIGSQGPTAARKRSVPRRSVLLVMELSSGFGHNERQQAKSAHSIAFRNGSDGPRSGRWRNAKVAPVPVIARRHGGGPRSIHYRRFFVAERSTAKSGFQVAFFWSFSERCRGPRSDQHGAELWQ